MTGACSNRLMADRVACSNSTRVKILDQALNADDVQPRLIEVARPLAVREAVKQVLEDSQRPLRYVAVVELVSRRLGCNVSRSTVRSALSDLAASPTSSVIRKQRGLYETRTTFISAPCRRRAQTACLAAGQARDRRGRSATQWRPSRSRLIPPTNPVAA